MPNNLQRIELFIVVVIIALFGIVYAVKQSPALSDEAPELATNSETQSSVGLRLSNTAEFKDLVVQVPTTEISYNGESGKTALEILQSAHEVELENDSVVAIDGVIPDDKHFWAMYINGNFSTTTTANYKTQSADSITWRMDEIANRK
jgi:hypothetical protein